MQQAEINTTSAWGASMKMKHIHSAGKMVDKAKASAMTEYFLLTSNFSDVQAFLNELME